MKKNQQVFAIFQKIYGLLERRQKQAFALILLVMAVSAALTQFTPKASWKRKPADWSSSHCCERPWPFSRKP